MFKYEISGRYFEEEDKIHFSRTVEAPDNVTAMKIVLADIMLENSVCNENKFVKLDLIHYECL